MAINAAGYLGTLPVRNGLTASASGVLLPARQNSMAATDLATGTVVVFGGAVSSSSTTTLGDTWTWDGTAWVQQNPATSPSARSTAVMSYDPDTGTVVLFGGRDAAGVYLRDTWTWDGTTWTQQKPATSPPTLSSAAMTYDAVHHQLVLFGGQTQDSPPPADCADAPFDYCHETWTWDGTNWTHRTPTSFPCSRYDPAMAFDGATANVVLFGGFNACGQAGGYLNDTWTWDGTTWQQRAPARSPAWNANGAMDYDSAHGVVTLVGMIGSNGAPNQTWTWDGTNWSPLHPPASPPATRWMPVIYDSLHHYVLQVGGDVIPAYADTGALYGWDGSLWWWWDGTEWKIVTNISNPSSAGPSGAELFGAVNPGETGGPFDLIAGGVNAVTGNLTTRVTDLAIPGRGPGLDFTRTYNSLDLGLGPVGYGWVDTYDAHLVTDAATGNITVTNPNGSTVPFIFPTSGQTYGAPPRVTATLTGNPTAGWTYTLRDQTVYTFDVNGHLTTITDRNGNQVTLTHDPTSGLLTTVTEGGGANRTLTFGYDALKRLMAVSDTYGRSVQYVYDDAHNLPNNLDHVVDANGNTTFYTYNANHQLLTATDQDGNVTTFAYATDGSNRIGSQTDQMSRQYQFGWLANGVTITDPRTIQTTITTDANEETTVARAGTTLWQFGYDQYDNKQVIVDPNGNARQTFYDALGNVTSTIDPLGHSTSATYNTFNEPLTTTDPNQVQTTYTYGDSAHPWLLTQVSTPLNGTSPLQYQTTQYTYGTDGYVGDLTKVADPDGKVWAYGYDLYGNKTSMTDPAGDVTTYGYDTAGRMTTTVSPKGNCTGCIPTNFTTTYMYDNENHVLTSTDPLNHSATRTYYPGGKLHTVKDADGNTTTYAYDGDEELQTVTRADNTVQTIGYDPNGNVTSEFSAAGGSHKIIYGYDNFDHVNAKTFFDDIGPRTTGSVNDPLGNPLTVTDPANQTTTYTYDAAERVVNVHYSDASTPDVTNITYDADGQRTAMTDGTGRSTWSYDSLHRMTNSRNGSGATVAYGYTYGTTPTFDLKNQIRSITYPTGHVVTRSYDDAGRITDVGDWLGHHAVIASDPDSNTSSLQYPNQTTATMAWDHADRLSSITDTAGTSTLASFSYGRDGNSQLQSASATGLPGPTSDTYLYTALNQLKQDTNPTAHSYVYDPSDNPTQLDTIAQNFDAADQLQQPHAIALIGTNQAGNANNTSKTPPAIPLPGQTSPGDLILVASTQPTAISVSASGYSEVKDAPSGTAGGHTTVLQKVAAPGDSAVSLTYSAGAAYAAVVLVYRGPGSVPLDAVGPPNAANSALLATQVTAPQVTTTVPGDRLIAFQGVNQNALAATWTAPPGMAEQVQVSSQRLIGAGAADTLVTAAGPTGDKVSSLSQKGDLDSVLVAVTSLTYDARGNRIGVVPSTGNTLNLGYDQANRLIRYGTTAAYTYNGDGLRMSKTIAATGTTEQFVYDEAEGLPLLLADANTEFIDGPGGQPLEQVTSPPAISLVGKSPPTSVGNLATSISLSVPSGVRANDQILVTISYPAGVSNGIASAPSGYVQIGSTVNGGGTAQSRTVVYGKTATSADAGGSSTFTFSGHFAAAGVLVVYRGVDPAAPVDTAALASNGVNGPTVGATPGTLSRARDEMVVVQGGTYVSTSTQQWTAETGPTGQPGPVTEEQQSNGTLTVTAGIADQPIGAAGIIGGYSSTFSVSGSLTTMLVPLQLPLTSVNYFHQDQLGSTRLLTDQTGAVVGSFTYDPYGSLAASTGTAGTPLLYAGQYRDAESGFYYMRARYYDPATAQFLSRDPKATGLSSAYAYAADSPLNATDPSGLTSCGIGQALCDFFGGNGQRVTDWFAAHSHDVARYTAATLNAASVLIPVYGEWRLGQLAGQAAAEATAEGVGAESGALRIFASEGRAAAAERAGALNPGASGELFATNGQYEFGNIAQSNLAISARGASVAGYWEVPAQYASKFSYVGRVQPTLLWEGGGREFTWAGSVPFEDLGPFQQIPWAAGQ